uniref:Uncharacterized protein n=1 Tax=Anopheles albimanus TaxID=7167 RepID=A0A182FXT0_ANOAL
MDPPGIHPATTG